jgi:Outer membrane protein beta-barrel domain
MVRILFLLLFITFQVTGQNKKKSNFNNRARSDQSKFLDKQWWLGFKAGVNLSDAIVEKRYTILTPTNYSSSATDKAYNSYNKAGSQVSLEITFAFKSFSINAQPTYRHNRFTYSNQFNWTNPENAAERLELKFDQEQQINFADFPLAVKYEIAGNKLRPYVQAGLFYSFLLDANKSVKVSGTDYASGGTNAFTNEPVIVGAKDLFENYWGLVGGVGLHYNLGNIRLVLDISYQYGRSNIANVNNRFSNDRLNGIGDAQDDLRLRHFTFTTGCLFPLRFLSNNFKALDK